MNKDWSAVRSEFSNPSGERFETDLTLSPPYYGFKRSNHMRRVVDVSGKGLRIERRYVQTRGGGLPSPYRFTTRWRLALPFPCRAKVVVKAGATRKVLDLRYAVPGGISGVKAGERLPGLDAMDEHFDDVVAVSGAEVVKINIPKDAQGEISVQLDRGDGLAAVVSTRVPGWAAVEVRPVVEKKYVQITFIGAPIPMDAWAKTIVLPFQVLSARRIAVATPAETTLRGGESTNQVRPRIRVTGKATAVNEIDGASLVWIPAGKFRRGSARGQGGGDERPRRKIFLDGYWIYKYAVTLKQYLAYCEATGRKFKPTWGQDMHAAAEGDEEDYAVLVNWYEASEYAKWAGGGLPTEAQWEKAARGTDGRIYPWGDRWDPNKCVSMERTIYKFSPGFMPVGSCRQGASPYGVEDMAGNVWEWVADWYEYEYYRRAPSRNPRGPAAGTHKVLRGGCSLFDERFSRTTARMVHPPHVRDWTPTGFRCVIAGRGPPGP